MTLLDALTEVDWKSPLASLPHDRKEIFHHESTFCRLRHEFADSSQSAEAVVYGFLARVCYGSTFIIEPIPKKRSKESEELLSPLWKLSSEELEAVKVLLGDTGDLELDARFGDVLWLRNHDHRAAKIAVEAYLASARAREDPDFWPVSHERYKRALAIGGAVKKGGPLFELAVNEIEAALERLGGDDPLYFSLRLAQDLSAWGGGNPTRHAELLERRGTNSPATGSRQDIDADYLGNAAGIYRRVGDAQASRRCALAAAEALVKHANTFMEKRGNRGAGAWWLERAILAFRAIPGTETRQQELSHLLVQWQGLAVQDAHHIEIPIDVSPTQTARIEAIARLPFDQAVRELSNLVQPPPVGFLRRKAQEEAASPAFRIMPPSWSRADGKNDAVLGGLISDGTLDPDDLDKVMHSQAPLIWGYLGHLVAIATSKIAEGKSKTDMDLTWLVQNNRFIPRDRTAVFMRGLVAGFELDAELALHLLVPQIENSLRHLLTVSGVVTFSMAADHTQDERMLNWLLERPQLVDLLGADMVFDLRGLLVERTGLNLRNELAHGMIPDGRLRQPAALYVWWIVLRLCVLFESIGPISTDDDFEQSQGE